MMELTHNLFSYATKELSQDAFIAWLCSFSLDDCNDSALSKCSKKLIGEFLKRGLNTEIDYTKVSLEAIEKQKFNIDILLSVKYKNEVYKIIIEDKVNSSQHDGQLTKYRKKIEEETSNVIGIYFKTGFQSDLSEVYEEGYKVFDRNDMLMVLRECNTENAIFNDYRAYWENFESIAQSYKTLPIREWSDWQAVNGFYDEMRGTLKKDGYWADYDWSNNPGGGFWAFWYGDSQFDRISVDDYSAEFYLQIESEWNKETRAYDIMICSKLKNLSPDRNDNRFLRLKGLILQNQVEYGFHKPKKLGSGKHITMGVYRGTPYLNGKEICEAIYSSLKNHEKLVALLREQMKK